MASASRYRGRLAAALVLGALGVSAASGKEKEDKAAPAEEEIDPVALAAKLIKDGHAERAKGVLSEVDPKKPGVDLPRFYTLKGMAHLQQKEYSDAREALKKAIGAGQAEPAVFLYLAQAEYGLKDHKGVLGALAKAGAAGRDVPATFLMRSQAHWHLEQRAEAIQALDEGARAFPGEREFVKTKLFYLIDLGLFQEVTKLGETYLSQAAATADDYAAVGEGLRRSKQRVQARRVLESARLHFPEDEKLLLLLAHTYLDDEHPLAAAMLFEEAARKNEKYALEAAELYLKAGRLERALFLNARVGDQKSKMKQRLGILLRLERFDRIAGMAPRLSRLGLLEDENVRYALAYGYFKSGEYGKAESELKYITDPRLFNNAIQLRKAMESCRQAGWECL